MSQGRVRPATYSLLVLTQRRMDNSHVEEDLGGVGNLFEFLQRGVEFAIVILREGRDPSLYFL